MARGEPRSRPSKACAGRSSWSLKTASQT